MKSLMDKKCSHYLINLMLFHTFELFRETKKGYFEVSRSFVHTMKVNGFQSFVFHRSKKVIKAN